ncbi:MAG: alkaline phosphatase family protein, partial [Mycobacteriales bacterium]
MSVESVSLARDALAGTDDLVIPDYAGYSLSNLLPSAIAAVGQGGEDLLGLPRCRRICVLLVDGLGSSVLRAGISEAPFFRRALADQLDNAEVTTGRLTAGFPSTTGASLASIGTGLPPSRHGLVGYRVLIPEHGRLMSLLQWDDAVDPSDWQPHPTVFEQLADAGISSAHVASSAYESSGLTRAAFRGARYVSSFTPGDLIANIAQVSVEVPLVFGYYADLDQTGHGVGVDSEAWRHQLAIVDRMLERLVTALPADTALVVTADHGMVDVSEAGKRDVDADPSLREGVALVGGEA